jgi:broad specificity phosphatase PhoE
LSDTGARDVAALAQTWNAQMMVRPTRIVSSDLARARESAAPFAARFGLCVEYDSRLREMNFGAWDGREWSEIERQDTARFQRWADRWTELAPPDGETVLQLRDRARSFLDGLDRRYNLAPSGDDRAARDDETVLVVTHAGWIRAALSLMLGEPASDMFSRPVDYARAFIVARVLEAPVGAAPYRIAAANVTRIEI